MLTFTSVVKYVIEDTDNSQMKRHTGQSLGESLEQELLSLWSCPHHLVGKMCPPIQKLSELSTTGILWQFLHVGMINF